MMYTDEYAIVDVDYIVHAAPILPCEHVPDDGHFHIGVLLVSGPHLVPVALSYPTKGLRDQAFEKLVAMVEAREAEVGMLDEEDA